MAADPAILTGRPEPPVRRTILRAGPVTAELDGPDLRRIRIGGAELVQRVYMAVRDAPWNTIPGVFTDWSVEQDEDAFRVRFAGRHAHEDIDFRWQGRIDGSADGTIRYELDGVCHGVFAYSKIGLNVHHALDGAVGRRYTIVDEVGRTRDGVLPDAIDPQRLENGKLHGMFEPYREIAIEVADGLEAVVALEGDLLELQDHRNWIDANFKSYATPLALGFPFTSENGRRIRQVLTISHRGTAPAAAPEGPVVVTVGHAVGPMPALGFGQAGGAAPLSLREASLVRAARPAHLRVDVVAGADDAAAVLERAAVDARATGTTLELAVHANEAGRAGLEALAAQVVSLGVPVARVLVYPRSEGFTSLGGLTPPPIVALVREVLEPVTGPVPFAGGTNQFFSDINRDRPSDPVFTGICFSISPTVHAADDLSVMENAAGAGEVVRMARSFAAGRPVVVSPVSIATRFGPYPAGPAAPGTLPAAVDVRQASLLGAAWTAAALGHLARAGASSVTWYETAGWQGIAERDGGSPHAGFPSVPGQTFPLYHVLADAGEWGAGTVHASPSARPLEAEALVVRDAAGTHALVANMTPDPVTVALRGLGEAGAAARVRMLDAATAGDATADPVTWRATAGTRASLDDGSLVLGLGAYAVARVDVAG